MEQIKRYPSIAALARDADDTGAAVACKSGGLSWYGGESAADSLSKARRGDTSLVAAAEKLLAKLAAEIDVPDRPMIADVAGAYPIVAEYLAGMPECMRRRAIVENERAPVRIYFCPTASASVSADQIMRRGVTVLALVLALSRFRPVELWVFNITRRSGSKSESVIAAPVNTAPLDIATAAYVTTSAGFVRRLLYGLAGQLHFGDADCDLSWPSGYADDATRYLGSLLARLGGNPAADLIIGPANRNDPLIDAPLAWLQSQIAKFQNGDYQ